MTLTEKHPENNSVFILMPHAFLRCTEKKRHPDFRSATIVRDKMQAKHPAFTFRALYCALCNGYHVGRENNTTQPMPEQPEWTDRDRELHHLATQITCAIIGAQHNYENSQTKDGVHYGSLKFAIVMGAELARRIMKERADA